MLEKESELSFLKNLDPTPVLSKFPIKNYAFFNPPPLSPLEHMSVLILTFH